ncbi:MAG: hypothetical protein OEV49_15345 [candidate division Zixibacteria bacterium]|nr:hypothetical protein [candidate division Zixibacteria bacterium]MDH3936468.1 hypothetical protein [candidate division Zixibacteria bacterium]MDH4034828.1 hypothetical protein [candidate division Zixibacteria bacterium]
MGKKQAGSRKQASTLRELMIIRDQNRDKIDSINQNLGSALGFKYKGGVSTNQPAVIIFVPDKVNPGLIPKNQKAPKELKATIDGDTVYCPTDVVRGGKAEEEKTPPPLSDENAELVQDLRQGRIGLVGGVQLGAFDEFGDGYLGTAACAVVDRDDDTRVGLLTNQHVSGGFGRQISHPLPGQFAIGRTAKELEYQPDEVHYDDIIDEAFALVRVDCGFVKVNDDAKNAIKAGVHSIDKLGEPLAVDYDSMDIIGTEVTGVGRTRGKQHGVIAAFAYEWLDDEKWSVYTDFLIIGEDPGGAFSDHGDSGKLIATTEGNHPVALLWGGWQERLRKGYEQENWTYAINVNKVLEYLNVTLLT